MAQAETSNIGSQSFYKFDGGNFALVRFSDSTTPNRIWMFDYQKAVYLPVLNQSALQGFASKLGLSDVGAIVNNISSSALTDPEDDTFQGQFLGNEYAMKPDGTVPDYPSSVTSRTDRAAQGYTGLDKSTGKIFGQARHDVSVDSQYASSLIGMLNYLESNPADAAGNPRVDAQFLHSTLYNTDGTPSDTLKLYMNAVAYGGYSLDDVFRDLQFQDAARYDTSLKGLRAISSNLTRSDYMKTEDAAKVWTNANIVPDSEVAAKFSGISQFGGLTAIPSDYWTNNAYTQAGYVGKPTDLDEARKLDASTYDAVLAIANAQTEQEREAAKGAAELALKEKTENLGSTLSSNALTNWNNIQSILTSAAAAGKSVVGDTTHNIEQQALQTAISNRQARKSYDLDTEGKVKTEIESAKKYGTSKEISDLVKRMDAEDLAAGKDPDQYRSVLNGLKLSSKVMAGYSMENLKKAYPLLTENEINKYVVPTLYGENGTVLSTTDTTKSKTTLDSYITGLKDRQDKVTQKKHLDDQTSSSKLAYDAANPSASQFGTVKSTEVKAPDVDSSTISSLAESNKVSSDSSGKISMEQPKVGSNETSETKYPKDAPGVKLTKGKEVNYVNPADADYWVSKQGWNRA